MAPCKSGLLPEGLPCMNNNIEIEIEHSIAGFYKRFEISFKETLTSTNGLLLQYKRSTLTKLSGNVLVD